MANIPTKLVPTEFKSLTEALAAIGNRPRVDYMATIGGRADKDQSNVDSADLEFELTERGFDPDRDSVLVWLPERLNADIHAS